jgi:hypothetical protein
MGILELVFDVKVIVSGRNGVVPSGGTIDGVWIFSRVAFPVSNSAVFQSAGTPLMVWSLNRETIGELPVRSAGTGMKKVTLLSRESVVMVKE